MAEYTLTAFYDGEVIETLSLNATTKDDAVNEANRIAKKEYGEGRSFQINETRVVHEFSNPE